MTTPNALAAARFEPPHPADNPNRLGFMAHLDEYVEAIANAHRFIDEEMIELAAIEYARFQGRRWEYQPEGRKDLDRERALLILKAAIRPLDKKSSELLEELRMKRREVVAAYDHACLTVKP